jgi:hypothetical protein
MPSEPPNRPGFTASLLLALTTASYTFWMLHSVAIRFSLQTVRQMLLKHGLS